MAKNPDYETIPVARKRVTQQTIDTFCWYQGGSAEWIPIGETSLVGKRWQAIISITGEPLVFGTFRSAPEASAAVRAEARKEIA